jgi:hypothetical protein
MKPVSLMYWDDATQTIQTVIKQQPDSIHTKAFSVSFDWYPAKSPCGSIPALEDYRLRTTIICNIDLLDQKFKEAGGMKFSVMDEFTKQVKNECFKHGVVVDPDCFEIMWIPERLMEVKDGN